MANFDYETGAAKPELSRGGNTLGLLLLVAIGIALLALISFFSDGAPPVPGDVGAAGDAPAATAPAASDPVTPDPTPVQPAE